MEIILKILGAGMPIVGILIGASIQSYYSKRAETKKQALSFKSQPYLDYLKSLADSAHIEHLDNSEIVAIYGRAADAKTRISIFGSQKVVEKLAQFIAAGECINSNTQLDFVALCNAMREDYHEKNIPIAAQSMLQVLFSSKST